MLWGFKMGVTVDMSWGFEKTFRRGLAQAGPGMWWAPSLTYDVLPHEPRKTLLSEYQSLSSEWLSRPGFGLHECYSYSSHHSGHSQCPHGDTPWLTGRCFHIVYCPVVYIRCLFHMAHHYCQATAGTNVGRILWYTPMRITLWELLRAIWCPLLTLSEFHVCIMMNNRSYLYGPWEFPQKFHVFFFLTAIHSYSSRSIGQVILFPFYAWRSQSLEGLQLVQSYRANKNQA